MTMLAPILPAGENNTFLTNSDSDLRASDWAGAIADRADQYESRGGTAKRIFGNVQKDINDREKQKMDEA